MKRFLSILLIAAGLFALYGDYVNITDIFACKTYWEETSSKSEDDLNALGAGLTKLKKNRKSYNKAKKQLASGKKSLAAAQAKYAALGGKMSTLKSDYNKGVKAYKKMTSLIKEISTVRTEYKTWKSTYKTLSEGRDKIVKVIEKGPEPDGKTKEKPDGNVKDLLTVDCKEMLSKYEDPSAFVAAVNSLLDNSEQTARGYKEFASNCATVSDTIAALYNKKHELYLTAATIVKNYNTEEKLVAALNESQDLYEATIRLEMEDLDEPAARDLVDGAKAGSAGGEADLIISSAKISRPYLKKENDTLYWLRYYVTNSMKTYSTTVMSNADKLKSGQDAIAKQVSSIASDILGNSTYKNAVRRSMDKDAIKVLEMYKKKPSPLNSSSTSFAGFKEQMDEKPGLDASLQKAQKTLTTKSTDLKKAVTTAKSKYTASYKTYKAYPKKLQTAQAKLDKLEEEIVKYEEGEKASKKGLTALVNERPEGDLESIKDRVGGSENFDDGKGNLDIDKGMEAVDAGEAYWNDAGDMIRNELTGRAIGTAASIGAAILALLAALLSLFRSNRGGAMLACISAMVAAAGVAMGKTAGDVFSVLAGSKVGELPWTSAMVLAGVAMIFAIVHFSAKIEEPLDK